MPRVTVEKRRHVAIVDDDEACILILKEFLESKGMTVEGFSTAEALLAISPHRFSAVLLDINLPGIWGSECGFLLRCCGYQGTIIAISGNVELWSRDDLHDLGFTYALGKPIKPNELISILKAQAIHGERKRKRGA